MTNANTTNAGTINAGTTTDSLKAQYGDVAPLLPGAGLSWLNDLRESGLVRFGELGLPTQKIEEWRYTSLRGFAKNSFDFNPHIEPMTSIDKAPSLLPMAEGVHRLVFINGRFHLALSTLESLPDGAILETFANALEYHPALLETHLGKVLGDDAGAMAALNSAFMTDGVVLHLKPGVTLAAPIEIVQLGLQIAARILNRRFGVEL